MSGDKRKKVYILKETVPYEGEITYGIFTTKRRAEEIKAELATQLEKWRVINIYIEPWELNKKDGMIEDA